MTTRYAFLSMLLLLVVSGGVATRTEVPHDVSLDAVLELWGDVLRDVDQFGLKLTRVSEVDEMKLGRAIHDRQPFSWIEDASLSAYVSEVGQELVPGVLRRRIKYTFHVVDLDMVNAFALPGGQIFITVQMLALLRSEAQLAAVLGHEIAHVDLKHCIEHYQMEEHAKKLGFGAEVFLDIAALARAMLAQQYSKYEELEADAEGARLSAQAGYDPRAAAEVFAMFKKTFGEPSASRSHNPLTEVTQVMGQALGSFLASHPLSREREKRLRIQAARYRVKASAEKLAAREGRFLEMTRDIRGDHDSRSDARPLSPSHVQKVTPSPVAGPDLNSIRVKADHGDAAAQYELARLYYHGRGLPQDYEQARHWYQQAAAQNFVAALYNLGAMYGAGIGTTQDYSEAARLYRAAAERGFARAQYGLGYLYASGKGVARDDAEARRWYWRAAEQGHINAQLRVASMCRGGLGGAINKVAALKWLSLAAKNSNNLKVRASAERRIRSLATGMARTEIREANRQVIEWQVSHQRATIDSKSSGGD